MLMRLPKHEYKRLLTQGVHAISAVDFNHGRWVEEHECVADRE